MGNIIALPDISIVYVCPIDNCSERRKLPINNMTPEYYYILYRYDCGKHSVRMIPQTVVYHEKGTV